MEHHTRAHAPAHMRAGGSNLSKQRLAGLADRRGAVVGYKVGKLTGHRYPITTRFPLGSFTDVDGRPRCLHCGCLTCNGRGLA